MKIAVVGTGSVGRRHLRNLLALGCHEVFAVSVHQGRTELDLDGTVVPCVADYDVALAAGDAVVIANPTSLHRSYLEMALAAGRHVYLEKPVSAQATGMPELDALARQRGLTIAVGTQFRFNAALNYLKTCLQQGALGDALNVMAYSGEHIGDYHPNENYRESYAARAELGGGILLTQIHQLDYLNWLFGPFATVQAWETPMPDLGIDVEACVSYVLAPATGSRTQPRVQGHLNYVQRPKSTGMIVNCRNGQLKWCYEENTVESIQAGAPDLEHWQEPFDRNQMFVSAMVDFLDCIAHARVPRSPFADGIVAVRIVEAIKRSVATGAPQEIAA